MLRLSFCYSTPSIYILIHSTMKLLFSPSFLSSATACFLLLLPASQAFQIRPLPNSLLSSSHLFVSSTYFLDVVDHQEQKTQPKQQPSATTVKASFSAASRTEQPANTDTFSASVPHVVSSGNDQPTLYDILGASPHETRAQLKQRYVQLAKQTHPDAVRSARKDHDTAAAFSQIAAAWAVLGDAQQRQRYDRSLQAQAATEQFCHWAERFVGAAVTAVEFSAKTWSAASSSSPPSFTRQQAETA